jgi:hypothetical protein
MDIRVRKKKNKVHEREENDADAPHIGALAVVLASQNNLRAGVVRRAARRVQERIALHQLCHAKVGDLDLVVGIQQKVLWLQVAVADAVQMAVLKPHDDLRGEAERLLACYAALLDDVVEQLPITATTILIF